MTDWSKVELSTLLIKHRQELAPRVARCETEQDKLKVAAAFQRLGETPGDPAARLHWMSLLEQLAG